MKTKYVNTSFLCNNMILYLTTSVSNNLDYLQVIFFLFIYFFLREKGSLFEKF